MAKCFKIIPISEEEFLTNTVGFTKEILTNTEQCYYDNPDGTYYASTNNDEIFLTFDEEE